MIRAASFVLAFAPDLVFCGSKPRREIARNSSLRAEIRSHLRSFADVVAYPPHQVMIGNLTPETLWDIPRPWHTHPIHPASPHGPAGVIIDEPELYAWLARADAANLVRLEETFAEHVASLMGGARVATATPDELLRSVERGAETFFVAGDRIAGAISPGHDQDETLTAPVLLENLVAKVTGGLALRHLVGSAAPGEPVDFLLGCGEEAVGDRYQRGGGNLAKAMGELAGVRTAGGADVKAFCAGPVHSLIIGGALVACGLYRRVVVVAGGSLAKLGMKFLGHLASGFPILEDILAGMAIDIVADDGRSPVLRLDVSAVHRVADGAAPHQMAAILTRDPLQTHGLRITDVDRFSVELHNPDITEPAGSGDVPYRNYQMIAALAAQSGEISRDAIPAFIRTHGMPGFSPTQGHIPSAVPYLPHAIVGLSTGGLNRVQLIAKGSLFLGRMTEMSDGASVLLERNGR
ncbi:MAG: glycine/sarcosine/betaine reductase complex component C subunit beta [Armatimonadota bacterium]|nr:glycine/sarcosine/betaine reductase complex component C subunit beta [Armatimonadota bacterium]